MRNENIINVRPTRNHTRNPWSVHSFISDFLITYLKNRAAKNSQLTACDFLTRFYKPIHIFNCRTFSHIYKQRTRSLADLYIIFC